MTATIIDFSAAVARRQHIEQLVQTFAEIAQPVLLQGLLPLAVSSQSEEERLCVLYERIFGGGPE